MTAVRKLTIADYERIPADLRRHEIIDGEEYVTFAPDVGHQTTSRDLEFILRAHVARQHLGNIYYAPIDVVLSDENVVQPDLIFVSAARSAIITPKHIQGVPDLVIEILSPSTASTDRVAKRDLYERAGVLEYWIVDRTARLVEVHVFGSTRHHLSYGEGETFESALLPGLKLRVADFTQPALSGSSEPCRDSAGA